VKSDRERLPRRRNDVELRDDGHDTWLVSNETHATHRLNPTARAIWELCDGTTTLDELAGAICEIFDVPRDVAISDVREVVDQFSAADLVDWPGIRPESLVEEPTDG
jgi:hypothetical protein